jgi:transcription antitermination factor NusG
MVMELDSRNSLASMQFAGSASALEDGLIENKVPAWYAVRTLPRHEKYVAERLRLRGVEHFVPCYCKRSRWKNGTLATSTLPLFPGYVFVRIANMQRVSVLSVNGVHCIVTGASRKPAALPESDMNALRSGLHLHDPVPHEMLTAGQQVRIRSGALAGLEGIVVRTKSSLRVVITLNVIQQSVAVEVAASDLEPLPFAEVKRK